MEAEEVKYLPASAFDPTSPLVGMYENVEDGDYRLANAVAHSDLRSWVFGPTQPGRHFLVGRALHDVVLRPDHARDTYVVTPEDWKLNTKDGKAAMQEFIAANPDKTVLRPSERAEVGHLVNALRANEDCKRVLDAPGEVEVAMVGQLIEGLPVLCKGLADKIVRAGIVDIKTTGASNEDEFVDAILRYGYDAQAAYYTGLYELLTAEWRPFVWVCVSKRTLNSWVTVVPAYAYHSGRRWNETTLRLYARHNDQTFGKGMMREGVQNGKQNIEGSATNENATEAGA